ncbi:MAG TPA: hypothetical protein VFG04_04205 [Planctomycetaceae bacterium]|jgi:hypothetical protein|nr:hypothetical protein [Planctomycetaceae bacterium]
MSNLPPQDFEEEDERPGVLGRVRPFAKIVFGFLAVLAIVTFAVGLWHIVVDVWGEISPR